MTTCLSHLRLSQVVPCLPAGHLQVPVMTSHEIPTGQSHDSEQLIPKRPDEQTADNKNCPQLIFYLLSNTLQIIVKKPKLMIMHKSYIQSLNSKFES